MNETEEKITELIEETTNIYNNIALSETDDMSEAPLIIRKQKSVFFDYYKISNSDGYFIFIGPCSTTENVKPFICYSKHTENMSLEDVRNKLFFLKLWKEAV